MGIGRGCVRSLKQWCRYVGEFPTCLNTVQEMLLAVVPHCAVESLEGWGGCVVL